MKEVEATFTIMVPTGHYEHKTTTNGGESSTWIEGPPVQKQVIVSVDLQQIAALCGIRAVKNRSGKSKFMGGAVLVRAVRP